MARAARRQSNVPEYGENSNSNAVLGAFRSSQNVADTANEALNIIQHARPAGITRFFLVPPLFFSCRLAAFLDPMLRAGTVAGTFRVRLSLTCQVPAPARAREHHRSKDV